MKPLSEQILDENLWGVHKELIKKHWSFKKQVLQAMEEYKNKKR